MKVLSSDIVMQSNTSPFLEALYAVGHSIEELQPAFPENSVEEIRQLVIESGACLNRPVISYGMLGLLPQKTSTFCVSEQGYRLNEHPTIWPPDPNVTNIFFFGGSTGMGFGVADKDTIPSQIEKILLSAGANVRVYNFAYGSFTSRQEFLRLLDLIDKGFKPDLAIFLDGINDTHYAFGNDILVNTLNDLYLSEKRRRRLPFLKAMIDYAKSLSNTKKLGGVANYKPASRAEAGEEFLTDEKIQEALDRSHLPGEKLTSFHKTVSDAALNWYRTSRDLIIDLSEKKKFQTLFVWQPNSYFATKKEQRLLEKLLFHYRYNIFCGLVYRWLESQNFTPLFDDIPQNISTLNLASLGNEVSGPLYIDCSHYSPLFCKAIAKRITDKITGPPLRDIIK